MNIEFRQIVIEFIRTEHLNKNKDILREICDMITRNYIYIVSVQKVKKKAPQNELRR